MSTDLSLYDGLSVLADPEYLHFPLHCTKDSGVLHTLGDYTQYNIQRLKIH